MELPNQNNFAETEKKWQNYWHETKLFVCNAKPAYSIDTPPPTLSGRMHIGHAFSYAQEDFVARYKRMKLKSVFYPFGTDDNGLPTERLVEKLKKVRPHSLKRSEFVELCYSTVREELPGFVSDWKNIGMSCDFHNVYSTISPHSIRTSQASFLDLQRKGHVIREKSPVSWCTSCQTAVAQAEFESVEMSSHFNDIVFKVGGKEVIVATTRPELLPACVAVIAHPEDKRYKEFIGKFAEVPIFGFEVPIIADSKADPEKGTGIVMCCTFGDKTDIEWWREHKLPLRVVTTPDGILSSEAGKYAGLKIKEARKKIIEDLKDLGLLINQKEIMHAVNVHERCAMELEFLETPQWFIRVLDKKKELLGIADKIRWWPEFMKVRYVHWVENLQWDWCISRQRFYGVAFPVWYCKSCGECKFADDDQLPVDPSKDLPKSACSCGEKEFEPENDVMDTWATSSVTPEIALDWVNDKKYFDTVSPMSIRPQAHDIIRTWAFYTIVKSFFHHGRPPWKNIMISGHVRVGKEKMSKSKGNVVDPRKVIAQYGADVLRYWAAGSKLGEDLPFLEKELVAGKKLVTKLWNASKFAFLHIKDFDASKIPKTELFDRWMLSQLNKLIYDVTNAFENYDYSKALGLTDHFFWHTLCDNYLEIVKDRIYNPDARGEEARKSAQYVLYNCLLALLKLFAPVLPHITEELYQAHFASAENRKSIHIADWPEADRELIMEIPAGEIVVSSVEEARKEKTSRNLSLKAQIKEIRLSGAVSPEEFALVEADIKAATHAEKISYVQGEKFGCEIIM